MHGYSMKKISDIYFIAKDHNFIDLLLHIYLRHFFK